MFSKGFQKKGRIPTIAGVAFPVKESQTDANISRRHFSRPFVLFLLLAHTRLELPARQQRTVVDSVLNILFGPLKRFWVVFCWFLFHLSVPRTWVLFLACWHTSAASASAAAAAPTDMYPSVKWQHFIFVFLYCFWQWRTSTSARGGGFSWLECHTFTNWYPSVKTSHGHSSLAF